jgi:hypothetical protein
VGGAGGCAEAATMLQPQPPVPSLTAECERPSQIAATTRQYSGSLGLERSTRASMGSEPAAASKVRAAGGALYKAREPRAALRSPCAPRTAAPCRPRERLSA